MKRIVAFVLALTCCVALALVFSACNDNGTSGDNIFYMEYNGTKIELGANADPVISKLGTAKSIKELGDCGGFGAQIKYTYDDFELYTLKSGDDETVDQISFTSDLVSTSKNISLGDSKDKVIEAYGESQQTDRDIMYTEGNMTLKFKLDGGKVVAIDYIRSTK